MEHGDGVDIINNGDEMEIAYLFSKQPDVERALSDKVDLPDGQYDLTSCPKAVPRPMTRGKLNKYEIAKGSNVKWQV